MYFNCTYMQHQTFEELENEVSDLKVCTADNIEYYLRAFRYHEARLNLYTEEVKKAITLWEELDVYHPNSVMKMKEIKRLPIIDLPNPLAYSK